MLMCSVMSSAASSNVSSSIAVAMIPPDPPPLGHLSSSPLADSTSAHGSSAPDQQPELFETSPPPWELTNAEDIAMASVVFSDAPYGPYDYRIPDALRPLLAPGMRVKVPLGKRKAPMVDGVLAFHNPQYRRQVCATSLNCLTVNRCVTIHSSNW